MQQTDGYGVQKVWFVEWQWVCDWQRCVEVDFGLQQMQDYGVKKILFVEMEIWGSKKQSYLDEI